MTRTTRLQRLPFVPTPPARADVEAAAATSPLVATLAKLRDHLGPDGRELSEAGGIRFAGEALLADILGIPELHLPDDDDADPLRPDPVPRATLALGIATESGVIETVANRLVPVAAWDEEDIIVKAAVALSSLIELGPMRTSMPAGDPFLDLRNEVLDGLYLNWLAALLPDGRRRTVDHFVNWAADGCREQLGCDPFETAGELEMWVENGTCYLIDTLAWAGAIEWFEQEVRHAELHGGAQWLGGGWVRLTALGRHVLPDHLAAAGLALPEPEDQDHRSAAALLGDLLMTPDEDTRREMITAWRPELDRSERARLITTELLDTEAVPWRWVGFEALQVIGPKEAAPFVRQLLDSPASEEAAQFLVDHDLADVEDMRRFLGLGPLVGRLASLANDPEQLNRWFVYLLEKVEAPDLLLEVIALYPTAEATMLLTAAARHVTDARFADLIRAAEAYHHECLAERDPAL